MLKCEHVFITNKPSTNELNKYYKDNFWDNKNNSLFTSSWVDNLKIRPGSYERYIRAWKQFEYIVNHKKIEKMQNLRYWLRFCSHTVSLSKKVLKIYMR